MGSEKLKRAFKAHVAGFATALADAANNSEVEVSDEKRRQALEIAGMLGCLADEDRDGKEEGGVANG